MQENRTVCLGCTRSDFSEVLTFPSILPLKIHRVLLLVIQELVLPALLQDGYREELGWRKRAAGAFRGNTLQRTITKVGFKEKEVSLGREDNFCTVKGKIRSSPLQLLSPGLHLQHLCLCWDAETC